MWVIESFAERTPLPSRAPRKELTSGMDSFENGEIPVARFRGERLYSTSVKRKSSDRAVPDRSLTGPLPRITPAYPFRMALRGPPGRPTP